MPAITKKRRKKKGEKVRACDSVQCRTRKGTCLCEGVKRVFRAPSCEFTFARNSARNKRSSAVRLLYHLASNQPSATFTACTAQPKHKNQGLINPIFYSSHQLPSILRDPILLDSRHTHCCDAHTKVSVSTTIPVHETIHNMLQHMGASVHAALHRSISM